MNTTKIISLISGVFSLYLTIMIALGWYIPSRLGAVIAFGLMSLLFIEDALQ